jgi:hypothetical protein
MTIKTIPKEVQAQVEKIITEFNRKTFNSSLDKPNLPEFRSG